MAKTHRDAERAGQRRRLTDHDVLQIIQRVAYSTDDYATIAAAFGITASAVRFIANRKRWQHLRLDPKLETRLEEAVRLRAGRGVDVHSSAKMTRSKRQAARRMQREGMTQAAIANALNVAQSTVCVHLGRRSKPLLRYAIDRASLPTEAVAGSGSGAGQGRLAHRRQA